MKADRILVTGATGFIGRRLVKRLLIENRRLTLPVRNLEACPVSWHRHEAIRIVQIDDIASAKLAQEWLSDASAVVHLAGLVRTRRDDEAAFRRANVEATRQLANATMQSQARTFIFLSSIAAITANASTITVSDATSPSPATTYGHSKLEAEGHVRALAEQGLFAVSLRPPLVIGAEGKGNWQHLQWLAATGWPLPFAQIANRRSFCSVETLCALIARMLAREWSTDCSGEYCIADPEPHSLPEIVAALRRGMAIPERLFSVNQEVIRYIGRIPALRRLLASLTGDLVLDPSRCLEQFDFHPELPLLEAVEQSGAAYLKKDGA